MLDLLDKTRMILVLLEHEGVLVVTFRLYVGSRPDYLVLLLLLFLLRLQDNKLFQEHQLKEEEKLVNRHHPVNSPLPSSRNLSNLLPLLQSLRTFSRFTIEPTVLHHSLEPVTEEEQSLEHNRRLFSLETHLITLIPPTHRHQPVPHPSLPNLLHLSLSHQPAPLIPPPPPTR